MSLVLLLRTSSFAFLAFALLVEFFKVFLQLLILGVLRSHAFWWLRVSRFVALVLVFLVALSCCSCLLLLLLLLLLSSSSGFVVVLLLDPFILGLL